MIIDNKYIVSNTYASKSRDKTRTYPAAIRVKRIDGVALASVTFEERTHDPLGYVQRSYLVSREAAQKRQELINALLSAGVPAADVEEILKPVAKQK